MFFVNDSLLLLKKAFVILPAYLKLAFVPFIAVVAKILAAALLNFPVFIKALSPKYSNPSIPFFPNTCAVLKPTAPARVPIPRVAIAPTKGIIPPLPIANPAAANFAPIKPALTLPVKSAAPDPVSPNPAPASTISSLLSLL